MASGRKDYFRHYYGARKDQKIRYLMDKFGKEAYFFYFTIIELCAEQASHELKKSYEFHASILRQELGLSQRRLNLVLNEMQSRLLLDYTLIENTYKINLPNLAKYMGKYTNKNESNSPNKRKEKKRKENKNINKKNNYTPDDLMQLWNEIMPPKFEFCRGLYSEAALKNFQITSQYVESLDDWKNIFLKCKEIPNLNGDNNLKFKATLNWLVDFNKLEPVLNGAFGAKEKTGMQLLAEKWGLSEQV